MKRKSTVLQYLTQEDQFDQFLEWRNSAVKNRNKEWFSFEFKPESCKHRSGERCIQKTVKSNYLVEGSPLCIASFAGNERVVDYLLNYDTSEWLSHYEEESDAQVDSSFLNHITYSMKKETKDTVSEWVKCFHNLSEIVYTLPSGSLECFRIFLQAEYQCDFRNRENLMLLSMCTNRKMWEFLIEHTLLEEAVVPIAAGYAVYYGNKDTAEWLLQRYGYREVWDKYEGGK